MDPTAVSMTALIALISSSALVVYHVTFRPRVEALGALMPVEALGGVLLAGILFPLVNATLEELVFRGILFDSLESEWGWKVALATTSIVFGYGHMTGYPPGWLGAVLAGIYGGILGLMRLWVGGLALPILAHVAADATIYGILVYEGALE
jgi:membrane protease YdiL (CAAX protease family)